MWCGDGSSGRSHLMVPGTVNSRHGATYNWLLCFPSPSDSSRSMATRTRRIDTTWDDRQEEDVIMSHPLTELLQTVEVAEPQEAGGLQVFGLRWHPADGLSYTTLDEALAASTLEVTEVNESGRVPVLKVVN